MGYSIRVIGSKLPSPSKTLSQTRAATAKRRTIVGPRPTCMNIVATAATISTTGIKISGLADLSRGKKLAPNSAPRRTSSSNPGHQQLAKMFSHDPRPTR